MRSLIKTIYDDPNASKVVSMTTVGKEKKIGVVKNNGLRTFCDDQAVKLLSAVGHNVRPGSKTTHFLPPSYLTRLCCLDLQ